MTENKARLQYLDSLRGIAIFMVVAFHASIEFKLGPVAGGLLQMGNQGVQLFFLISAITMCLMWDAREQEAARTQKFYVRRFLRIAPLYWFAIVFYALMALAFGEAPSTTWQMATNAFFIHGFFPSSINSAVPGGWSIAVEMTFYVVFPGLILLGQGRANRVVLMFLFAIVSWLLLGVWVTNVMESRFGLTPIFIYYSQLTQFPIFPIGICIYAVSMRGESQHLKWVFAIAVVWIALALWGKIYFGLTTRPYFWIQIFLFALLIHGFIKKRVRLPWFSGLGAKSYSIYLFHFAIIKVLAALLPESWHYGFLIYSIFMLVVLFVSSMIGQLSLNTFEKWSSQLSALIVSRKIFR